MSKKKKDIKHHTSKQYFNVELENNTKYDKWLLIIIVLLPLIIYYKVTNFDFIMMDDYVIIKNHLNTLENVKNIFETLKTDAFLSKQGNAFYRPVQTITFMFDALISGKNPWMYHLTNLIIHIATCISFFYFLKFIKFKKLTAFLVTLLFSVHPIFTDAISGVPSRGDLLIGLLGIWLIVTFGKQITTGKTNYLILHFVLFFILMFTKETSVFSPVILLFYYLFILKGNISAKKTLLVNKELLPYYISWSSIIILFLIIRSLVLHSIPGKNFFGIISFIKNLPTIPILAGKFIIPYNLSTLPLYDTTSLVIGIVVLIIVIYIVIKFTPFPFTKKYNPEKNEWFVLMGFVWFLIFTIPPLFYRITDADNFINYFEHRAYLPMIGLFISSAYILNRYIVKIKTFNLIIVSTILISIFAYIAYNYCDDYKDSLVFFSSAIDKNPLNAAAHTNRGFLYFSKKNFANAMSDYNEALEINEDPVTYFNRGCLEAYENDHISAEKDFNEALRLDSTYAIVYVRRANEKLLRKDYSGVLLDLDKASKFDPSDYVPYFNKGDLLLSEMNYNEAIISYTKAIELNPSNIDAYNNRGIAKLNLQNCYGAIDDFKKVIASNPLHVQAYINLGLAFGQLNQLDNAIDSFNKAINISGKYAQAFYGRGMAKQLKGDLAGACNDWKTALTLGYPEAGEMLNKFCK